VWEKEEIAAHCQELSLIAGIDPLMSQVMPGDLLYFRLREGLGRWAGSTEDDFVRIHQRCVGGIRVYDVKREPQGYLETSFQRRSLCR
jgi:hypothetical protein